MDESTRRSAELDSFEVRRQRAITERLLLTALYDRDVTTQAVAASERAAFLASASRALAQSLDEEGTREIVRRRSLPRTDSWCIVDIIELGGADRRLPVVHPDPSQQEFAQAFADRWFPLEPSRDPNPARPVGVADTELLDVLRELGFGRLLVIPLVVHTRVIGAISFITRADDPPFTPEEVTLASGLADICALALDNARLYREAGSLREIAEAANRAKSIFLGNMSHELMTPLNAIGGYVALIEMGLRGPVTAEQRIDLARIQHNQAHLLTLIANMLSFVRTESDRLDYHFAAWSAHSALEDVAEMLQGAATERALIVVVQPSIENVLVWADANRVRQILVNLVTNAVKYGSANGGRITLESTATADLVSLHVVDMGAGIPAERQTEIFEPFVQLASGLSDRRGGVGLGLAISRDLARAMQGDLTVESGLGVGSRFTLSLPRATGAGALSALDSTNAH